MTPQEIEQDHANAVLKFATDAIDHDVAYGDIQECDKNVVLIAVLWNALEMAAADMGSKALRRMIFDDQD